MGLAAYGNPQVFRREFQSIMPVGKEDYAVDPEAIVTFRKSGIDALFMDDIYLTAQT